MYIYEPIVGVGGIMGNFYGILLDYRYRLSFPRTDREKAYSRTGEIIAQDT